MTVVDQAELAVSHAANGDVGGTQRVYRVALDKFEPREMVVVTFQTLFVSAIVCAGLEQSTDRFDNLVRTAHQIWKPQVAWELICKRLARVACEAEKAGKHDLVWAVRDLMIRSRPPKVHQNAAYYTFWKLTEGIKVRHLPKPRSPEAALIELYA